MAIDALHANACVLEFCYDQSWLLPVSPANYGPYTHHLAAAPKSTKLHTMGFKPPPVGRGASSRGRPVGEGGEGPALAAKPGNGTPHSIFPHAK
eukprot:scaffold128296_cov19-Tisochrysis_lutea.AAC.1